jgi:DNA-binding response OmpR family regulator
MDDISLESNKDKLLVVDDDPIISKSIHLALADYFEVKTVSSGEACLQIIDEFQPKLVILDIEMPGMDGYETCRNLRAANITIPVIFLSGHDRFEERLEAFDSGGDDFITKPSNHKYILRKVQLAIHAKMERDQIASEKASYEQMAMSFLGSMGENGVLLNYTRAIIDCPNHAVLLEKTMESTQGLGLECHIQLRFSEGLLSSTPQGPAGPLEESVLTQVADMGRLFQFKKRLVTNFEHITIIIKNMPDNEDLVGRIKDNIAILAEIADASVKVIDLKNESAARAERIRIANLQAGSAIDVLRDKYRHQQAQTRMLLETLIRNIESSYVNLGLLDSQEYAISDALYKNNEQILHLFDQAEEFEKQFSIILNSLGPRDKT